MKKKDSKENKDKRIILALENLKPNEIISPTNLAKKIVGIHVDTLKNTLDLFDSLKEISFEIIRKNGKIKFLKKTDNNLTLIREVRTIRKDLIDIKNTLDELHGKKKGN